MKNHFKYYLCFLVFYIVATTPGQVKFSAAGLNAGWYKPSLDYWKNTSSVSTWNSKFNASISGGVNLYFNIKEIVDLRVSLNYWKQTIKEKNIQIGSSRENQELSLQFIPIDFDLFYRINYKFLQYLEPYVGLGGGFVLIEKSFARIPNAGSRSEDIDDGWTYNAGIILGIEAAIISNINAAIEFKYVFGKYTQQEKDIYGVITDKDVSIAGPHIKLLINYLFNITILE